MFYLIFKVRTCAREGNALHPLQTDDAAGELTAEGGVETCLHEELATEGLALEAMAALSALKLVEAIGGVGIQAGHMPTGRLQADVDLEFITEEHSLALVFADEHLAAETLIIIR